MELTARERLIVALDMDSAQEALGLADRLGDAVSFYKVGWQLFMSGAWKEVILGLRTKKVFVDLKLPGDIDNTIASVVRRCVELECVKFLTLSESVRIPTVRAARKARGEHRDPELLVVPWYSSLGEADFSESTGRPGSEMNRFILERSAALLDAGCDGLVASGPQIKLLRDAHPATPIVSPGIRMPGSPSDDHKRFTTPSEAVRLGADYLVVGRPIRNTSDPKAAALRIIEEIESSE